MRATDRCSCEHGRAVHDGDGSDEDIVCCVEGCECRYRLDGAPVHSKLGWWCIAGEELLDALRRASSGEDADLVYAELYANTDFKHA